MPFLQLNFETGGCDPELLESACFEAGALSVTLSDAADAPIYEPGPGETPLWPRVKAGVLFTAGTDRARVIDAIEKSLGSALPSHTFLELPDQVWERAWMVDFKPMRFGKRLWIYPHGHEVEAADATVVRLDPGLAFGTGTHATTAMCLQWLDAAELTDKEVIDYGCGSGVLAIAALKLGARRALAVDHDAQALLATRDNAVQNGVEAQLEIVLAQEEPRPADVIVANILALPLIELAPRFRECLRPGGEVVLSGIMKEQAQQVLDAYRTDFEMRTFATQDNWVCLHGTRRKT